MRYTAQQKENALKLADAIGAGKASEQLSISYQSLLAWRKKMVRDTVPAEPAPHVEKNSKTSGKANQPLEQEAHILRHEITQLKKQLVRQSAAIQALSKVDE